MSVWEQPACRMLGGRIEGVVRLTYFALQIEAKTPL